MALDSGMEDGMNGDRRVVRVGNRVESVPCGGPLPGDSMARLTPPADLLKRAAIAPLPPRAEKRIQNVLRKLPGDATARKGAPVTTGCLDYFPLALAEIARLSKAGNDQHNPGQPLHWARHKSSDHADCITRHLIERGTIDTDGQRHTTKLAWRALALLQEELEAAAGWHPASE